MKIQRVKYHKKIRLNGEIYSTPNQPCSITICTVNKESIFANKSLSLETVNLLKQHADRYEIPIYAYCIMPDHIHLLTSGSSKKGIIEFIREIKSLSTKISWKYGYKGKIWQTSFYDHFLRKAEDLEKTARYILNNPVRRKLVDKWRDYGLCGSFIFDL
ncbi:transposase [candidate division WOR-3 bacterium]|nr:transposase [candidate division WOR-3 bacterium]